MNIYYFCSICDATRVDNAMVINTQCNVQRYINIILILYITVGSSKTAVVQECVMNSFKLASIADSADTTVEVLKADHSET